MDNMLEKSWIEMSEKCSVKGRILKQFIKVSRSFLKDKDINKNREL